ncbi:MAG TPA: efflux transporter outer membrane subunit [Burkholderiaceae bacterium]
MPRLAGVVLALALAACAPMGPDYQRPSLPLPAAYPGQPEPMSAPDSDVSSDWWTLYGDARLTQLVDAALEHNTDVAQAVARVEQADAQLRQVAAALRPEVDAGADASRSRFSGRALGARGGPEGFVGNDLRLALSTSFELDVWGRLRRGAEAARALALGSQATRDTVRLSIAGLVAQTWFALRSLDEQVALTRATLRSREESVRLLGLRLSGGTGSRLDVEQAETLRADAAVQLRELERQRALARSQLALLTGQPALALDAAPLGALPVPPAPPLGLPSALLARRPDVRAAEQQLVAANAQIGVARAEMFPQLSLTGSFGQESTELQNLLGAPARIWSLGFGMSLPLFDGGRRAARVDETAARDREALAAYQGAVQAAFKDVADALANARAAALSQDDVERRERATDNALRLAKARYESGYSAYLELLDAQRTATAAQLDRVRNRQARLAASIDLFKALGGGWREGADARAAR